MEKKRKTDDHPPERMMLMMILQEENEGRTRSQLLSSHLVVHLYREDEGYAAADAAVTYYIKGTHIIMMITLPEHEQITSQSQFPQTV